jgi:hypothetical protein
VQKARDRAFLVRLLIVAWLVRLAVVILFNLTGAVGKLGLSSDSFYYHRTGIDIAGWLEMGMPIAALDWIDSGWFQFTGLVYYLLSPNPVWMQLINITFSTLAVYFSFKFALRAFGSSNVARLTAVMVAVFPSFVYWSTMMLKDPAALLAITMIACSLVYLRQQFQLRWLVALAVGLLIYLGVRQYMFLVCLLLVPVAIIPFAQRKPGTAFMSALVSLLLINAITIPLGYGFLGLDEVFQSHYFDLEYINQTRINIGDHGRGAIFENPETALWGSDPLTNLSNAAIAVFYFFVSLDLSNLRSHRQLMALPEVILFISILPSLVKGTWQTWKTYRRTAWPLLVLALAVLAVYSSATTNLGALFRWRMQSLPMFMAMTALGIVLYQKSWLWRFARRMKIVR